MLNSQNFSVRTSKDVLGVELCGGFKNVVALAAGFSVSWIETLETLDTWLKMLKVEGSWISCLQDDQHFQTA